MHNPGCRCIACFAGSRERADKHAIDDLCERALTRAGYPKPKTARLHVVTAGPPKPERPAFGFDKRQPWDPRPARSLAA